MGAIERITSWLETHWATPAYAGWLLLGIAVSFFAAATNTMAGWLYAISGIIFAMLGLGAVLSVRSLRELIVQRNPIPPVTVGDQLTIEVEIINQTKQPKTLLQVQDVLPFVLGKPVQISIETIPSQDAHRWIYYQPTQKRGVYRWDTVQLRTGAPLGLFWCRRFRDVPAKAYVYPTVLPLNSCPLIDQMGQDENSLYYNRDRRSHAATEGVTRALRPYRVGDPIRLIHWRTSARYGEFKVRELEVFTGGQEVIIGLDSVGIWDLEDFEQAVITAASIYFYAGRSGLNAKLWTAATGLLWGNRVVLETLAAVNAGEDANTSNLPNSPTIWLTQNSETLNSLPNASRWVLWQPKESTELTKMINRKLPGVITNTEQPLQLQLQQPLNSYH